MHGCVGPSRHRGLRFVPRRGNIRVRAGEHRQRLTAVKASTLRVAGREMAAKHKAFTLSAEHEGNVRGIEPRRNANQNTEWVGANKADSLLGICLNKGWTKIHPHSPPSSRAADTNRMGTRIGKLAKERSPIAVSPECRLLASRELRLRRHPRDPQPDFPGRRSRGSGR